MNALPLIHGLSRDQLAEICRELGEPAYRAGQLWHWLYRRFAADWSEMKNIPSGMRQTLGQCWSLASTKIISSQSEEGAGSTTKWLVALPDGNAVEEVQIPAKGRTSVCISSQVGCKFSCAFCASGQAGFQRNLETGELVGQVVLAARHLGATPSNLVFMGMGEPLDNYEAVLAAIRIINDHEGLSLGARRITISTCGIIPGIQRLAQEGLQVELSISLHAPDDALRTRLMPVNGKYPLSDLLAAARAYAEQTGRLITFEYTLIQGVNDSPAQAEALARILSPIRARVNLIPLSVVAEFDGQPSAPPVVSAFLKALERAGINTTLRQSKGGGVNAACGQLRGRMTDDKRRRPDDSLPCEALAK
ncbi:MAG: 23S rRNA (adenine(2503)-C(2))-methyltransferase RlmN [Lentisphaerae bacterium]|nr:23S rRNA (adenine(2503)-C(2))-methyltransferase RlmN [Lentisphaerota bacterium]